MARDGDVAYGSWLAELPGIGVSILTGVADLAAEPERRMAEQLRDGDVLRELPDRHDHEDLVSELGLVAAGILGADGFDAVYEPTEDTEWRSAHGSIEVWERWQARAGEHDRPMSTCGDIVDFMTELGALERVELDGLPYWRLGRRSRSGKRSTSDRTREARVPAVRRPSRPRR